MEDDAPMRIGTIVSTGNMVAAPTMVMEGLQGGLPRPVASLKERRQGREGKAGRGRERERRREGREGKAGGRMPADPTARHPVQVAALCFGPLMALY